MPKLILIVVVIALLAFGGYYFLNNKSSVMIPSMNQDSMTYDTSEPSEETADNEIKISLDEQNTSGEMGVATLTEVDGKTIVRLEMKGNPYDGTPQPAHIHTGSCPDVGAIVYPLTNVVNGMSETTLDVSLKDLASKQPLGINVHKSVPESKVYVSCGNLNLPGAMMEKSGDEASPSMMKY